ncbi:MAG: FeoB-associated Cys-rich membrane protein [Ruminococcaceae bacterium]|nr:FeoB-associated Cys-rich membrane protein [Oscillospiraceae bacterium]
MLEIIIIAVLILWGIWAVRRMSRQKGCGCGCSGCTKSCSQRQK